RRRTEIACPSAGALSQAGGDVSTGRCRLARTAHGHRRDDEGREHEVAAIAKAHRRILPGKTSTTAYPGSSGPSERGSRRNQLALGAKRGQRPYHDPTHTGTFYIFAAASKPLSRSATRSRTSSRPT